MIRFSSRGSFTNTHTWLDKLKTGKQFDSLDSAGAAGVAALASATPTDTGQTANSWTYKVFRNRSGKSGVAWYNTNMVGGTSVAILLEYGHGTGTGGYVSGAHYISPAIRPVMDKIAEDVWRKVKS